MLPETFPIDSLNAYTNVSMTTDTLRTSQLFKDLPTVFEVKNACIMARASKVQPRERRIVSKMRRPSVYTSTRGSTRIRIVLLMPWPSRRSLVSTRRRTPSLLDTPWVPRVPITW